MWTVPSTAFERESIAEFLNELADQTGAVVEEVWHPEDDPNDPLTVDAAVRINGRLWAIDHMRLAYEPTVVPAGDEASRKLQHPLEKLAEQHNCCLYVGVLPPRSRERTQSGRNAYYSNVIKLAHDAIICGEDWFDTDGVTSVQVIERAQWPNADTVTIATWLAETASIEAQVVAALEPPLTGKLLGQLANAKRTGYAVMLLIDQVQDPNRRQPTMFLASWATVKKVVDAIVALYPGIVDSVWFRAHDGSFKNLTADSTE